MATARPESRWSRSDPERRQAAINEYRRQRSYQYHSLPPIGRRQALAEDEAQARALADVEAGRIGRAAAMARFAAWVRGERAWIARTSTRFAFRDEPD